MLRITIVRLLADIVNRCTLISKQKMYPPAAGAAVQRVSGLGFRVSERLKKDQGDLPQSFPRFFYFFPYPLSPGPYTLFIQNGNGIDFD
jgi:hypothetical protein